MVDFFFELDYSIVVAFISIIIITVVQFLLCFKSKKLWLKILPAVMLTISTIVFSALSSIINGWDGFSYLFFAFLSLALTIICGICWGIWAIIKPTNK